MLTFYLGIMPSAGELSLSFWKKVIRLQLAPLHFSFFYITFVKMYIARFVLCGVHSANSLPAEAVLSL